MPIKNMNERTMIQRLGKFRLGKKNEQRGFPEKLDYFLVDSEYPALNKAVADLYGEKPKSLDIMFLSDNDAQVIPQNYEKWAFSGLQCRGDGMEATEILYEERREGDKTIKIRTGEKKTNCAACKLRDGEHPACKPVARLMFALHKIPGLGVWQISTSSFNSIKNINRDLKVIRSIFGRISMVPLKLLLTPTEVKHNGRKNTVYLLSIQSDKTLEELMNASRVAQIQGQQPEQAALPEPSDEGTAEEFFAEETADTASAPGPEIPGVARLEDLKKDTEAPVKQEDPGRSTIEEKLEQCRKLAAQIGYTTDDLKVHIKDRYHKTNGTQLDLKEASHLMAKLVIIARISEQSKGKFTLKQLDASVNEVSDIADTMLQLSEIELQGYEMAVKRWTTAK